MRLSEAQERWYCPICTAGCTFEAMEWCARREGHTECGYDNEQPIALGGAFEFVMSEQAYSRRALAEEQTP